MNPYNTWLKSIAIGLETMAKGIHSVAKTINDMADAQASEEPVKDDPESINTEPQPSKASEKAKPQGTKTMPPTDQVLEVIQKSKTGVNNLTISEQTGLNQKQVSSALLRLRKYGKVKSVKRGVHKVVLLRSPVKLRFDFKLDNSRWLP
jgi:predicted Rossmann fold nucleotide-binding protein DprA/Smf involved in DNA uptake